MKTQQRPINEIIIHCTATPARMIVTMSKLEQWHKKRGFATIGYHYVIDQLGKINTCRPEQQQGAHCKGHNFNSIGIAYIGGIDDRTCQPADTRTTAQRKSLIQLIIDICQRHDILNICGHNYYANKTCPCFNAAHEYYHLLP